jgi:magnesium-transporting ATPase (P-type)
MISFKGCVLYTGQDTKMMKNSKFKANKMSSIERRLNKFILFYLLVLFLMSMISFGASFAYEYQYWDVWYLNGRSPSYFKVNKSFLFYLFKLKNSINKTNHI